MKKNVYTILAMIFLVIAVLVISYVLWYQGAQEKALDYGNVIVNSTQEGE